MTLHNWNRASFRDKNFTFSFVMSVVFLIASLFVNFYSGLYATERASNSVTDIILSNIRPYDLDRIFIYGSWAFALTILLVCLQYQKKTPFVLKSVALFVFVRAIFLTLTHIGPFPTQIAIDSETFLDRIFISGGGLFFSGHTGMPFLLALLFWGNKP